MENRRDNFFLAEKGSKNKKQRGVDGAQNTKKKRQGKNFNQNRPGLEDHESGAKEKKPFDKKTYRLKKYSNKYKLEQWEEQRKKKLLRNYYKDIKNDPDAGSYKPKAFDEDVTDSQPGRFVRHPDLIEKENVSVEPQKKKDPFWKAKEQYNKIKQEKLQKHQELERSKEEKMQKLQEYKKKKHERFKKLSKKTKKGQPVMTGRLELLLEKLQQK